MKKQWRVAVAYDTKRIFLGGHGTHLAFVGLPGVEHVALADSNPDGLDERMRQLGVKRHYDDYPEVLDREKPQIVDAERVFRGGAIAPGRRLMRRALAQGTAQLPEIPFSTELPERAGNGTVESIRFGVDRGAVGLVRELVEAAAQPYGGVGSMRVIATGGDAPFFAAALPFLELAPEEFTHHGIRLAGGVL